MSVYVLIDDEFLVRRVWEMMAEKRGATLHTFTKPADFFAVEATLPRDAEVYVDLQLGDGVSGLDVCEQVAERGFTSIRVATGMPPDMVTAPRCVVEVVGKEPPF